MPRRIIQVFVHKVATLSSNKMENMPVLDFFLLFDGHNYLLSSPNIDYL